MKKMLLLKSNLIQKFVLLQLILISLLTTGPKSYAQESNASTFFDQGVQLFKEQKYPQAYEEFKKSLEKDLNPSILFNIGATAYEDHKIGLAAAHWRQTLKLAPQHEEALRGLQNIEDSFFKSEKKDSFSEFHLVFLMKYRTEAFVLFFILCLMIFAWRFAEFLGVRRRAKITGLDSPHPSFLDYLVILILILSSSLTVTKIYDLKLKRATIINTKTESYTAPDEKSNVLFQIPEASEVYLIQDYKDWSQIQLRDGSIAWIQKKDYLTSELEK